MACELGGADDLPMNEHMWLPVDARGPPQQASSAALVSVAAADEQAHAASGETSSTPHRRTGT